jgi:hypothetical protein
MELMRKKYSTKKIATFQKTTKLKEKGNLSPKNPDSKK